MYKYHQYVYIHILLKEFYKRDIQYGLQDVSAYLYFHLHSCLDLMPFLFLVLVIVWFLVLVLVLVLILVLAFLREVNGLLKGSTRAPINGILQFYDPASPFKTFYLN